MRRGLYLLYGLSVTRLVFAAFAPSTHWPLPFMMAAFLGLSVGLAAWLVVLIWHQNRTVLGAVYAGVGVVIAGGSTSFFWPKLPVGSGAVVLAAGIGILSYCLLQVSASWRFDRHRLW